MDIQKEEPSSPTVQRRTSLPDVRFTLVMKPPIHQNHPIKPKASQYGVSASGVAVAKVLRRSLLYLKIPFQSRQKVTTQEEGEYETGKICMKVR